MRHLLSKRLFYQRLLTCNLNSMIHRHIRLMLINTTFVHGTMPFCVQHDITKWWSGIDWTQKYKPVGCKMQKKRFSATSHRSMSVSESRDKWRLWNRTLIGNPSGYWYNLVLLKDTRGKWRSSTVISRKIAIFSHFTDHATVCSNAYSGWQQRNHQNSISVAVVHGIHSQPTDGLPHKELVMRSMCLCYTITVM